MKKAKVILIAIALLAVVGGALAFKAKRTPFPAYAVTGSTVTSFTRNMYTYRTIVLLCAFVGEFIDPAGDHPTTNTFTDLYKVITGYTLVNGLPLSATSLEFVCTPTVTATTAEF